MAYSDAIFTMLKLFSSFTDDKMILQAITVHDEFIIIYKGDYFIFWENDNALSLYCLLKRVPNLLNDIPFEQVRDFCPCHLFPPKDYYIHSFWSQNTETEKDSA